MSNELLLKYLRQYQKEPGSRVFAPLADLYRKSGKTKEALSICLEGLQHHPRYAGGRLALGNCYADLGRLEEAVAEYEYVLTQYPDNLQAIRGAARVYQSLNQPEKALRYYRMMQFLTPKDSVIRDRIQNLESQLRHPKTAPSSAAAVVKPAQLSLDPGAELGSTFDHYRLSALAGRRPAQRSAPRKEEKPANAPERIQKLFRLLRAIHVRRQSRLDGNPAPSA